MSNAIQNVTSYIDTLNPVKIVEDNNVVNKFITLYKNIHKSPGMPDSEAKEIAQTVLAKEQFNFMKLVSESDQLRKASNISLYGCFLDVAVNGLSLEQGSKPHCYLLTRNIKVKKLDGSEGWETRAYMQVSPYGELIMRMRAGHIKYADNPVIVYDCDTDGQGIIFGYKDGKQIIKYYFPKVGRPDSAKIVGGFIRIERLDGSSEVHWVDISEMDRLKGYSNKNNKGDESNNKANALYSSNKGQIDTGFFEAKIIKHAFRSYPKVKVGDFSAMATEAIEKDEKINYDLNTIEAKAEIVEEDNKAFENTDPIEQTQGIKVETNDDEF